MVATIQGVSAFRTSLPLARPYHLSLVTLNEFDSVLIGIRADGIEGSGEITDVPGYFHQTPEDAWDLIEKWAPGMIGQSPGTTIKRDQQDRKTFILCHYTSAHCPGGTGKQIERGQ